MYLALCCNQNFLTIFLMDEPYRVPYFPVTPTFLVLFAIITNLLNIIINNLYQFLIRLSLLAPVAQLDSQKYYLGIVHSSSMEQPVHFLLIFFNIKELINRKGYSATKQCLGVVCICCECNCMKQYILGDQQYDQINIMNKGNTTFYHKHIQSNIHNLEERKDKFINHRLQFLKEYCEPIQQKIDKIKKQIQRYKIMRDTQEEVIENDPEILAIKGELINYNHTHKYYDQKLNQYEKKSIELEQYNSELDKRIDILRKGIKSNKEEYGFRLPNINRNRMKTSSYQKEEKQEKQISQSYYLPQIKIQTQHLPPREQTPLRKSDNKKRIIGISEKIQRVKSNYSPTPSPLNKRQHIQQIKLQQQKESKEQKEQLKKRNQQLRQKITQFNRTQILFHQCFETKKASVQKSVSQLQSKLITNRMEFLSTCQAIGSKQNKISFEQFSILSSDEIITLFISFVWLNRKLNNQFLRKRKQIMDLIKKLPKVQ